MINRKNVKRIVGIGLVVFILLPILYFSLGIARQGPLRLKDFQTAHCNNILLGHEIIKQRATKVTYNDLKYYRGDYKNRIVHFKGEIVFLYADIDGTVDFSLKMPDGLIYVNNAPKDKPFFVGDSIEVWGTYWEVHDNIIMDYDMPVVIVLFTEKDGQFKKSRLMTKLRQRLTKSISTFYQMKHKYLFCSYSIGY